MAMFASLITSGLTLALGATGLAPFAFAEFTDRSPSINGTGETLPKGQYELGLMETDYGLTDDWLIRAPSAALLVGYGRVEVRRRFQFENDVRLSPYVFAETPRKIGIGADYGFGFGSGKEQSLTVGARAQFTPRMEQVKTGPRSRTHAGIIPNIEYDYYARGNDFYAGIADYIPYIGHTWSFKVWHVGLILSPYTSMIPLPYAYIRF